MPSPMFPRLPHRRRRWVIIAVGVVLISGLVGLICLPLLVRTEFVRRQILAGINATLKPGRLEVARFEVSWTGPTRLIDFQLIAPDGARVVTAPIAALDRSLGSLLFRRGFGTILLLDQAVLVIHRHADGQLDLTEALQSVVAHPDPTRDLTVRVTNGTLVVHGANLAGPIEAKTAHLDLHIPPAPRAMTWNLKLGHASGGEIVARGEMNRWTARDANPALANLELDLVAQHWPVAVRTNGIDASGALDGSIDLQRARERWQSTGNLRLGESRITGNVLAGETIQPGLITLVWDGKQTGDGWMIRRLTIDSPLGSCRAEGGLDSEFGPGSGGAEPQRIEGRFDLAALARQIPHAFRLRPDLVVESGTARFVVGTPAGNRSLIRAEATLDDLAARDGPRRLTLRDPATCTVEVVRTDAGITVQKLTARTAFASITASGRLDNLIMTGSADLGELRRQLADWVDIGRLDGSGRAEVTGSYQVADHQYVGAMNLKTHDLRIEGVASTPIHRTLASFDVRILGSAGESKWPTAWQSARFTAESAGSSGQIELRPADQSTRLTARLVADLGDSTTNRPVAAMLDGTWNSERRSLTCDRVSARIGSNADTDLELLAQGVIDATAGTIRFDPIPAPGLTSSAFRLAPAGLRISGLGGDLGALQVDAGFEGDLGGPQDPAVATDHWAAMLNARGDSGGVQFTVQGEIEPAPGSDQSPDRTGSARLSGRYQRSENRVDLTDYQIRSGFGMVSGAGSLDDPTGARRVDLHGQVVPDFAAITTWMAREIEPGARLAGRPRPYRLAGPMSGPDLLAAVEGDIGLDLLAADIYGMKLGPAPLVVRLKGGQILVDPISTTLNEGHVRLEPEIIVRDGNGSTVVRLGKNSAIRDARINDEVSRRVLAFVAPVLEGATRASGRVSVDLDRAEFPLTAGRSKAVQVDGLVVFDDVIFGPGELANDLLGAIGRRDAVLRLDRPVTLTIADGRINQSGLALPIGNLTRIEVVGWVDFDRNLALTATLPVTSAMLGNNALLADIAAGTQVRLPIGGTLNQPVIDSDAFAANLKATGKSLLTRGATRGALELLLRLGNRPTQATPNAPPNSPPLTPADRKALRQERKADRKSNRDTTPEQRTDP